MKEMIVFSFKEQSTKVICEQVHQKQKKLEIKAEVGSDFYKMSSIGNVLYLFREYYVNNQNVVVKQSSIVMCGYVYV